MNRQELLLDLINEGETVFYTDNDGRDHEVSVLSVEGDTAHIDCSGIELAVSLEELDIL